MNSMVCGWCGRPIENDFFWTDNTRGVKIHTDCLNFLWKLGIVAKESAELQQEILKHFQDIRNYHAEKGLVEEERKISERVRS